MGSHRARSLVGAAATLTLLALSPELAATPRALPPAATEGLRAALSSLEHLRLGGMSVAQHDASVELCERAAPGACHRLLLGDPDESCEGTRAGPWCARWTAPEPAAPLRDEALLALGHSASPWVGDTAALPRSTRPDRPAPHSETYALLVALALALLPTLAGFGAGRLARRLARPLFVALLVALALPAPLLAVRFLPRLGAWDVLCEALLFAAGLALGRARPRAPQAALLALSTGLGLLAAEALVRVALPPPPVHRAGDATLLFSPRSWDGSCTMLYAPGEAEALLARMHSAPAPAPPDSRPSIAHLGDSMTFGAGVAADENFVALLAARQPQLRHRNLGVSNTGTDYQLLLFRALAARQRFAAVALYVYVGNDLYDLDRAYECCDLGALLSYGADGAPSARCPAPRWQLTTRLHFSQSPGPYPLRVAGSFSALAGHLVELFPRLGQALQSPPRSMSTTGDVSDEAWRHFESILRAWRDELAAARVPFTVVLLPHRAGLEADPSRPDPSLRLRLRAAQTAGRLGLHVEDSWDLFAAAVARDGAARYFLQRGARPDIHFTPAGHRLLASWLEGRLPSPESLATPQPAPQQSPQP